MAKIADILRIVDRLAPPALAQDWDNVGLQAGSVEWPAKGVIIGLDADLSLLEKATEVNANIAITHHPLIFSGLKRLDLDTPTGRILEKAVTDRIAIFSAHTNLDVAEGGVNDTLSERLHLSDKRSFGDVGRIGILPQPETVRQLTERLKETFSIPHAVVVGDMDKIVKTVALCGGSGGSLVREAIENGADILITGDVKYHSAKDAEAYGLSVIDLGHFASETVVLPALASAIESGLKEEGIDIQVHVHQGIDPLKIC